MNISIRNSVIIALVQTGLLVAGILGAAASHKLASKLGYPSRGDHLFFINYAWLLMPVPLIWITITSWLLTHRHFKETWKSTAFMSGLAIAVLLITGAIVDVRKPWSAPRQSDSLSVTGILADDTRDTFGSTQSGEAAPPSWIDVNETQANQ